MKRTTERTEQLARLLAAGPVPQADNRGGSSALRTETPLAATTSITVDKAVEFFMPQ